MEARTQKADEFFDPRRYDPFTGRKRTRDLLPDDLMDDGFLQMCMNMQVNEAEKLKQRRDMLCEPFEEVVKARYMQWFNDSELKDSIMWPYKREEEKNQMNRVRWGLENSKSPIEQMMSMPPGTSWESLGDPKKFKGNALKDMLIMWTTEKEHWISVVFAMMSLIETVGDDIAQYKAQEATMFKAQEAVRAKERAAKRPPRIPKTVTTKIPSPPESENETSERNRNDRSGDSDNGWGPDVEAEFEEEMAKAD